MQDIQTGRRLPAPSRADRQIAKSSKGHCTGHTVLGDGPGRRMQAESHLELTHLLLLNADPGIVDLREQVLFRFGPRNARTHFFDVVATRRCGTRIAYTVKPEVRLRSGRFLEEMEEVAWWVREKRFADDVRLLTDADVDPVALHNAKVIAAVRAPDPEADAAAGRAADALVGIGDFRSDSPGRPPKRARWPDLIEDGPRSGLSPAAGMPRGAGHGPATPARRRHFEGEVRMRRHRTGRITPIPVLGAGGAR